MMHFKWFMRMSGRVKRWVPQKAISLFVKSKPTTEDRSGFILIIRGAISTLVGREAQQTQDEINVIESSHEEVKLDESQISSDSISVNESSVTQKSLSEEQATADEINYSTATLETKTMQEQQDSTDSIDYSIANVIPSQSYEEQQDSQDSISYSEATLIVLTFNETQQSSDEMSTSEATREVLRYKEYQYTHEIPVAYVPSDSETLEIRTLTEEQLSSDSLSYIVSTHNPFEATFYYSDYAIWSGTEVTTIYSGIATAEAYASINTVYGGESTASAYAEVSTIYSGIATATMLYNSVQTLHGGIGSTIYSAQNKLVGVEYYSDYVIWSGTESVSIYGGVGNTNLTIT